jgi:L-malate glycosyltransferase
LKVIEIIGTLKIGGAENQVVQLLNGWDPARVEKYLVCFSSMDTSFGHAIGPDVKGFQISLPKWGQIGCIMKLAGLFKKIRPHVVQSHMFHTNLYSALASRIAGVPVFITTEHGKNLWKNPLHHFIERRIISPLSTLRVAVSDDIRDIRVRTNDVPPHKVLVMPPCVSIPEKACDYRDNQFLRIGAVGRMVKAKDYPVLLHAFARAMEAGVRAELVFVGDGPEKSDLEELAKNLCISDSIIFSGYQANVEDWMREFDLVVFSSIREGIPVAMLEAMALGIPVACTRVGGIPEVIRHGIDGLLVEPGRPDALADAIFKAFHNPDLRRSLGIQGRKRVASFYSQQVICKRYEVLFKELLDRRHDND